MRTIRVTGQGQATAPVDRVGLRLEVVGHEMEYEDAVEDLNMRVAALRNDAKAAGAPAEEVKTTSFSVDVDSHWDSKTEKSVFNGYRAQHRLTLGCAHLTQLPVRWKRGELERPHYDDPTLELLRTKGVEHERVYLAHLRAQGLVSVNCPSSPASAEQMLAAEHDGSDVIHQATLDQLGWAGGGLPAEGGRAQRPGHLPPRGGGHNAGARDTCGYGITAVPVRQRGGATAGPAAEPGDGGVAGQGV